MTMRKHRSAAQAPKLRVGDLMVTDLHTVDGMATVADAIASMRTHAVGALVVERRDEYDEVGMIEVADIADLVAANRALERVNVYEVMSKPVVTVPADMRVRYATRLLRELGRSRAVVVDDARNAVGMVTLRDLVLQSGGT